MKRCLRILIPVVLMLSGCATSNYHAAQPTLHKPGCPGGHVLVCQSFGGVSDMNRCDCVAGLPFW